MKSAESASLIKTIVRENLKRFWAMSLFPLLLMILSSTVFVAVTSKSHREAIKYLDLFARNLNPGYVIAIICLGVGAGLCTFKYMQASSESNWTHSLPVRRSDMFVASYISGMIIMAAPLLITGAVNLVYSGSAVHVKWIFASFVICLFVYSVSALAASISGNMLMHTANTLLFVHLVPAAILMIAAFSSVFLLGFEGDYLVSLAGKTYVFTELIGKKNVISWPPTISYLLISVLLSLAAYQIYRRRAVEKTGDSLMFPWLNEAFMTAAGLCGASLVGLVFCEVFDRKIPFFIVFALFGLLLAFIPTHLLVYKNFRFFEKRKLASAAAAFIMTMVLVTGFSLYSGPYAARYLKDAQKAGVIIGPLNEEGLYDADFYKGSSEGTYNTFFMADGEKSVEAVKNIQKIAVKYPVDPEEETAETVRIQYQEKGGKTLKRSYYVSEKGIKEISPLAREILSSKQAKDFYTMKNLRYRVKAAEVTKGEYSVKTLSSENDLKKLKNALDRDLEKATIDDMTGKTSKVSDYTLGLTFSKYDEMMFFDVPKSFTNTLAVIEAK